MFVAKSLLAGAVSSRWTIPGKLSLPSWRTSQTSLIVSFYVYQTRYSLARYERIFDLDDMCAKVDILRPLLPFWGEVF
jgi:hypothetical protein